MDKIIKLFSLRLERMLQEYTDKVNSMSLWQIDNNLSKDIKQKNIDEKRSFLIEKFQINNPLYRLIQDDLGLLKRENVSSNDLKFIELDPRYLESIGLKESQIEEYFEFTESVKALL